MTATSFMRRIVGLACLLAAAAGPAAAQSGSPIPQTNWTVRFADSEDTHSGNVAANVFDGNPATMWHTAWVSGSPAPPHELQIDLGAVYAVNGFRYLPRQDGNRNGGIASYQFYVSTDGANWGTAVATGTFPSTASEQQATFTAKSGRYVRIRAMSEVNGNPWTSIAELNVLTGATAPGPPPSGSSISRAGWSVHFADSQETQSGDVAANAFDGNPATMWHTAWVFGSPGPPHELQINLGAVYAVSGFRYLPRQDGNRNGGIASYQFYVSTDGANWGAAVATGTFPSTGSEQQVTFTAKSGRYIRIRAMSEVNGNPWTSIAELNVLGSGTGTPGPANQAPNGSISAPGGNTTITAGQAVSFSGSGSDPDNNLPLTYAWSFGAGGPPASTSQNPGAVTFPSAGVYMVTLTVTDALGLSDPTPATRTITVQAAGGGGSGGGGSTGGVISRAGWSVHFADSQETQSGDVATNAFDGNSTTMWHTAWVGGSPNPPHELQINLGAVYAVSGFRYLPRQDGNRNGGIASYQFYVSTDGANWGTAVATGTFPSTGSEQQVTFTAKNGRYIRIRAMSEVNGNPWTSIAELNVLGTSQSGGTNQFPQISLTGTYNASSSSVSLAATASDPDGTVALVDFYAGSSLIRTDTSAPYTATASSIGPGTHSFVAAAQDNAGDRSASNTVVITVGSSQQPTRAVFTPSADHNSLVTRYVLHVFNAGANPATANPLATIDLGKPPVVNGECDVALGGSLSALSPGTYIATVSAVGYGGESQSGASPPFVKP